MAFSFLLSHVEVLSAHVDGSGAGWGLITSVLRHFKHLMEKPLKEGLLEVQFQTLSRSEWCLSCHSGTESLKLLHLACPCAGSQGSVTRKELIKRGSSHALSE